MEKYFKKFVEEAELFFVKKYIYNKRIEQKISFCLDVIFNITKNPETDYTKGLIIFSKQYGQGKSFFFEVVFHRHKRLFNSNLYKRTSAKELIKIYEEKGKTDLLEFLNVKNIFIDDIGDELKNGTIYSHFSNKLNVMQFVLLKRYEFWEDPKKRWRTFGTTNLPIQDIAENYDGRVADRLLQMCYIEEFDFLEKGSFRQAKESRKLTPEEIKANYNKFVKPVEVEKVDVKEYMNGLLLEPEDYLEQLGEISWNMIKSFLLENNYLKKEELENISEAVLDTAKAMAKKNVRDNVKVLMGNCLPEAKRNAINEKIGNLKTKDYIVIAENTITKRRFFELKQQQNFKF